MTVIDLMDNIQFTTPTILPLNLVDLVINLGFCLIASFLLRHLYVRRSISLSGKFHIATAIPVLACVTFLVIMVVKSSLALSLGLVGALSVIRFRTPIKEPEELVYLFLAIALGLGYGAGQTFVTSVVFVVIVIVIFQWLSRSTVGYETEYNLLIDWTGADLTIEDVWSKLSEHVSNVDLQKYNAGSSDNSIFLKIELKDISSVDKIVKSIRSLSPIISCSFYEARPLQ